MIATEAPVTRRVNAIDVLRGLVMVVMVLDHTRDYVHADATRFDPLDLQYTTVALFFTRWITHFCAPVFILLAGVSARLQSARMPTSDLSRFLLSRGAWLIVLEFTVVRITTWFNVDYSFLAMLQVIWAIGVSMIALGALVHLPMRAIAGIGLGMIVLHNGLDGIHVQGWQGPGTPVPGPLAMFWILLHQPGEALPIVGFPGPFLFVMYPLIPWVGVIAAGYVLGGVYEWTRERRRTTLLMTGSACIVAFLVIRATNLYGDPSPWSTQRTVLLTVLSFVNVTKYPPSLLYLLVTVGPALLALVWLERTRAETWLGRQLTTLGRVPLMFYLLQWPIAHAIAVLASYLAGKPISHLFANPPEALMNAPRGAGFPLPMVYVCGGIAVVLLLPICRWYADVKRRHPAGVLRYL
jgi:uncharacterized membrane protein